MNSQANISRDESYMDIAISQAKIALAKGNPPVGAVLIIGEKIVAACHNTNTTGKTWLAHAEQTALKKAARSMRYAGEVSQEPTTLYSTLQPCLMCFSTAIFCRIARVVYGLEDPTCGADNLGSFSEMTWYSRRMPSISAGIRRDECAGLFLRYKAIPPFGTAEKR